MYYLEDLHTQMTDYASGTRGQVRVFANISAINQFLPADLASFLEQYPQVQVHLEERNSTVTPKAIAENAADVGVFTMLPHGQRVETLPYRSDRLCLIVRQDHPLATRTSLRFADSLDWDFVGLRTGSAINTRLVQAAAEQDRELRLRIQVTGFDALCRMVAAGLGIAVAPENLTTIFVKDLGLKEIRLDEEWAKRELRICVRSLQALPTAARLLVDHLQARAAAG